MSATYNVANTDLTAYDVTWKSFGLGAVDKVDPTKLKLKTKPIKVGSVGDIVIGERIIGLEGTLEIEAREVTQGLAAAMMPWAPTNGTTIPLVPSTWHKDMYDYAGLLTLHPQSQGSNTAQDLNLLKAVPKFTNLGERDGEKDAVVKVEFSFFPDRTSLQSSPPAMVYGYIGAVPLSARATVEIATPAEKKAEPATPAEQARPTNSANAPLSEAGKDVK